MRKPSVSAVTAYFDALYKVIQGSGILPPMEPTLTIMPLFRWRMWGVTS
jgi:hypothetical protein